MSIKLQYAGFRDHFPAQVGNILETAGEGEKRRRSLTPEGIEREKQTSFKFG